MYMFVVLKNYSTDPWERNDLSQTEVGRREIARFRTCRKRC